MENNGYVNNEGSPEKDSVSTKDINTVNTNGVFTNGHTTTVNHGASPEMGSNGALPAKFDDDDDDVETQQQQSRDRDPIFFCRWIVERPKTLFGKSLISTFIIILTHVYEF